MRILNHGVKRWWQIDHVFKARQKKNLRTVVEYRRLTNCTKHRRSKQKTTDERRVRSHERHLTLRYHTTWQCSTRYDFENNILLGLGNIVEVERGTVLVVVEYPRKVPWKRKTFIVISWNMIIIPKFGNCYPNNTIPRSKFNLISVVGANPTG